MINTSKESSTNKETGEPSEDPEPAKHETSEPSKTEDMPDGKGRKTGGRIPHNAYTGLDQTTIVAPYTIGTNCPECDKGKLYTYDDKVIIRLTGGVLNGDKVKVEQVRCNLCLTIFSSDYASNYGSSKYDINFRTDLAINKYWNGIPFKRMETLYAMNGCPIPDATQWMLIQQISKVVEPVYLSLLTFASNCDVVQLDDTSAKILERDKEISKGTDDNRTGTFTSGFVCKNLATNIHAVLYFNSQYHAGENLDNLVTIRSEPQDQLVIMSDGLDNILPKALVASMCNCLAHGVRKFKDLLTNFTIECGYILNELKQVYEYDTQAKHMSPADRLSHHKKHSQPLLDNLLQWMNQQLDNKLVEPNSNLGKALKYMIKRWDKLTAFCRYEGAPIDNNVVERILKIAIRTRKNAMFYKTSNGAYVAGIMMSLIETCRINQINPRKYLNYLQQNAKEVALKPDKYLPWLYNDGRLQQSNDIKQDYANSA